MAEQAPAQVLHLGVLFFLWFLLGYLLKDCLVCGQIERGYFGFLLSFCFHQHILADHLILFLLYLLLSIYAQHCQSWVPSEAKERDFLISVPHLRTRHRILLCLRYLS